MGYKGYFLDNATYGADDFNNAFAHLTTAGVSLFNEKMLISGTNSAMANLVSEGTDVYNEDSCKVVAQNNVYKVLSGTCWLPDGTFCVIDDDGVVITPTEGVVNYVYIEHNTANNTIKIVVSQTAGDSQAVPLAFINSDGSVEDRRIFATAKVGLTSANQYKNATVDVKYYLTYDEALANPTVIDVGFTGFSYVYTEHTSVYSSENGMQIYDVSDCTEKQIDHNGTHNTELYIKKQGSKLLVYGARSESTVTMQKNFLIM